MSNARRYALWTVVGVVAIAALFIGLYFAVWHTSDPRGRLEARELTRGSGSFRVAAYDHFFDLCSSVQAREDQAGNIQAELSAEPGPAPYRVGQLQASLTAVNSQRDALVRRYNADASRDYTVGQFRDNDLPFQLDPNDKETECALQ